MFDLGRIVITKGIKFELDNNTLNNEDLYRFLGLHLQNISESCEDDRNYNLEDIKNKWLKRIKRIKRIWWRNICN